MVFSPNEISSLISSGAFTEKQKKQLCYLDGRMRLLPGEVESRVGYLLDDYADAKHDAQEDGHSKGRRGRH